ncbi:MAG: sugar phosphate isomerase/epimerase [Clostridia bacterium]|nr:sugar phosphate isomerase/epimerase [Clostridia bacterium]
MKTSTGISSIARLVGEAKAVELVGKAGFDAWDFTLTKIKYKPENETHPLRSNEYLKFARELKKIGDAYGMVCNQSHAPFPSWRIPIDDLKRAIECTAEVGGEICVIHPDNDLTAAQNAENYHSILPFAKDYGVKIATENMWNWDKEKDRSCFAACATAADFLAHVEAVNDPYLVACVDLGHAEMRGSGDGAANMLRTLGKHVQALHIHDNDCLHDDHQIPFSMGMDFEPIARALRDINYQGYLTLEATNYMRAFSPENALEGVKNLLESLKRLDAMI